MDENVGSTPIEGFMKSLINKFQKIVKEDIPLNRLNMSIKTKVYIDTISHNKDLIAIELYDICKDISNRIALVILLNSNNRINSILL